jgi:hypothetical protein
VGADSEHRAAYWEQKLEDRCEWGVGGNDARARLWSYGFEKEGKRINRYDLKSDDGRR